MKAKIIHLFLLLCLAAGLSQAQQPPQPGAHFPMGPQDPFGQSFFPPELVIQNQAAIGLTDEQKNAVAGKTKSVAHATEIGKWHELQVQIEGDEISVAIDGSAVGSFHSPGIAHPTKRMLRFSVPRNAVVDDVKIYRKG